MNKSKSSPLLTSVGPPVLKTSISLSDLQGAKNDFYFEEFFEGDGSLGIVFMESDGFPVVKSITRGTVASETYGLQREMILLEINGKSVKRDRYGRSLTKIKRAWSADSYVHLKFKKKIFPQISKTLNEHDLFHFYGNFIELGAKEMIDFEFVEYGDLIKMGMNTSECKRFKKINPDCVSDDE